MDKRTLGIFHPGSKKTQPHHTKKKKPHISEETKQDLVDIAVLLAIGFPSAAMVAAGGTGVFLGMLMMLVPGPHQPLALPVLATSLPTLGTGAVGATSATVYTIASS